MGAPWHRHREHVTGEHPAEAVSTVTRVLHAALVRLLRCGGADDFVFAVVCDQKAGQRFAHFAVGSSRILRSQLVWAFLSPVSALCCPVSVA